MSRLHRSLLRVLVADIVSGRLEAGERLPPEADLARRFDVSRGVARECIRGLEERGLVAVKHGRGATVRDPADWDVFDPDVLEALLAGPGGRQLRAEALECQRLFEVEAASLAAARAGEAHIAELARALESMTVAAPRSGRSESAARRYEDANVAFHRAVVRAADNRTLARMSEPLHRALAAAGAERGNRERRVAEHERILAAIAAGDPDAARRAMTEHLSAGSAGRRG
jgi:DNA-binding FadR family transcriptional regulator